ncbi:hypothetical protein EAO76_13610 [Streptomyces sp. sk2.1]|nr:hypothetical protein EAO76_13610 [Streptomyces sp. sk2.1]
MRVGQSACQEVGVGFFDGRRDFPGCSSVESADGSLYQEAVVPDVVARQVRSGQVERPSWTAHETPPATDGLFERQGGKTPFGLEPGRLATRVG